MDQMDLMDFCRIFHKTAAEHAFFPAAHGIFKIDYILGHKACLNKYKKMEITSIILYHNK
jgi:hypothetical protein